MITELLDSISFSLQPQKMATELYVQMDNKMNIESIVKDKQMKNDHFWTIMKHNCPSIKYHQDLVHPYYPHSLTHPGDKNCDIYLACVMSCKEMSNEVIVILLPN